MPRTVFVSQDVMEVVMPPFAWGWTGRRHQSLRALLDAFTEGDFITVGAAPRNKAPSAIMARVEPICAEVWDFRCLDPKPGIRVFGGFSEVDTFVALTWDYRENIEDDAYWTAQVHDCKAAWQDLFGRIPPHSGDSLDAYISYNAAFV